VNLGPSSFSQIRIHTWKNIAINSRGRRAGNGDNILSALQYILFLSILGTLLLLKNTMPSSFHPDVLDYPTLELNLAGLTGIYVTPCKLPNVIEFPGWYKSSNSLIEIFKILSNWDVGCFDKESELEYFYTENPGVVTLGIVLSDVDKLYAGNPDPVAYTLRLNSTAYSFISGREVLDPNSEDGTVPITAAMVFHNILLYIEVFALIFSFIVYLIWFC
jgi:hypothetical protein